MISTKEFKIAIDAVLLAVGKDILTPAYSFLCFEFQAGDCLRIIGLDGYRMHFVVLSVVHGMPPGKILLYGEYAKKVLKQFTADRISLYPMPDGSMLFTDGTQAECFEPMGDIHNYPAYEKAIAGGQPGNAALFNGVYLSDALKALMPVADSGSIGIEVYSHGAIHITPDIRKDLQQIAFAQAIIMRLA